MSKNQITIDGVELGKVQLVPEKENSRDGIINVNKNRYFTDHAHGIFLLNPFGGLEDLPYEEYRYKDKRGCTFTFCCFGKNTAKIVNAGNPDESIIDTKDSLHYKLPRLQNTIVLVNSNLLSVFVSGEVTVINQSVNVNYICDSDFISCTNPDITTGCEALKVTDSILIDTCVSNRGMLSKVTVVDNSFLHKTQLHGPFRVTNVNASKTTMDVSEKSFLNSVRLNRVLMTFNNIEIFFSNKTSLQDINEEGDTFGITHPLMYSTITSGPLQTSLYTSLKGIKITEESSFIINILNKQNYDERTLKVTLDHFKGMEHSEEILDMVNQSLGLEDKNTFCLLASSIGAEIESFVIHRTNIINTVLDREYVDGVVR